MLSFENLFIFLAKNDLHGLMCYERKLFEEVACLLFLYVG